MHLVVNKFGSSVHVDNRKFEIKTKDERHFFSANKLKSIFIMRGTKITADAIILAIKNDIDIVFFDKTNMPIARIQNNKFGSIATIRKQQLLFSLCKQALLWIIKNTITYKIDMQKTCLKALLYDRPAKKEAIASAIEFLEKIIKKINELNTENNNIENQIRALEGNASKTYFKTLSLILSGEYTFDKRSRQPAKDVFNATLNYIYGILYARVECCMVKAGLDPYIGLFHRDEYNKPVLVYDMIERYRVWADTVVMRLCIKKLIDKTMFSNKNNGLWLESHGKKIIIEFFNDYMEEIIQLNHRRRSRLNHILADMQDFASYLKNSSFNLGNVDMTLHNNNDINNIDIDNNDNTDDAYSFLNDDIAPF